MKRPLTPLEYALLGLCGLGAKSAYEIQKLFVGTPMSQFSSSPGSIYPALERLRKAGLVNGRREPGDRGSARRMLSLSAAGTRRLRRWLRAAPSREEIESDARLVFLRFSFMDGYLSDNEVLAFLDQLEPLFEDYRDELRRYVRRFRSMGALHAELGARHGVIAFGAHLRWIAEARRKIDA